MPNKGVQSDSQNCHFLCGGAAQKPPFLPAVDASVMHKESMSTKSILENSFYHDGRGPELQKVVWAKGGVIPLGFEYFNPDDGYEEENIKHIVLSGVQAYSMATEEVHGNILASGDSNAAILEVVNSEWLKSFLSIHLEECKHYQVMFYDEIYDIICESIVAGKGHINA